MRDCPLHTTIERRLDVLREDLRLEGQTRREEVGELWSECRSLGERLASVRPLVHLATSVLSGGVVAVVTIIITRLVGGQ